MPSPPSTPVGSIKNAAKKSGAKTAATSKPAMRTVRIPFIPYELPYNWAGNDQVVAAVLGCQTMGEFADYCRGKHLRDAATYWTVYWAFQEILITQDSGKISAVQLPSTIAQFYKDPKYWKLITDHPSTPITVEQMNATNNPQHRQTGELDKAVYHINTVKLFHYMLLHLDDHLNAVGQTSNHISGHELKDWMLVYMVFNRNQMEIRKRRKTKPLFSKEDFFLIRPHNKNTPPTFQLVIPDGLDRPAATDVATEGERPESEEEDEDDVERLDVQLDDLLGEQFASNFTKENIEAQAEMLKKFIAKLDTEQAELAIDSKNRVKNVRPSITKRQLNRLLARCMAHLEVVSDGLHGKMTDAPQTHAHATEAMNRLAASDKVPEVDAQWLHTDDAFHRPGDKADADLRADWLVFQKMVAGGYVDNDMAVGYVEACNNMHLDPKDPSWDINGGKCKLHPWQVIGADWLRRAKRDGGISPLLADDCGLGKTIQTLAALYADYLDAKAGRILPPYQPSLIIAPGIIAINWINDNAGLLRGGLSLWLWQGRQVDAGNSISVPKGKILDMNDQEMMQWIDGVDKDDPDTMREVIVTTYGTGPIRSLYVNGRYAHAVSKERAEEKARALRARREEEVRLLQADPDDLDDDAGEQAGEIETLEKPGDKWSCTLAGRFYRVCCDESHKAKSTRTNTFRWVQQLAPTNGYMFLSATPMPNTIEDMKCYLMLNWQEEWATDDVDPKFPLGAIGLWSIDSRSDLDDPDCQFPTQDCEFIATKAHLNPKLFRACMTPEGSMMTRVAARLLPAIQAQLSMRRTMSSVISWKDADGTEHAVRVGEEVPPFECRTVELAYKDGYNYKRFKDYHRTLAEEMSETYGGTQGPHQDSGKVGKRNMAVHKRLQVLSTSVHAERFTQSYQAQSVKTGVDEMNTLHEWGHDRGLSTFYAHATLDPNAAIPSSRVDMAEWLLRGSPKLCWLANYMNEKRKKGKRVAIFVVWPVCQWLIEATFELLGFDFVSIRSEKTLKLRQEAINTFCNLDLRCDGCVMSYACAGTGLNYQKATPYMIHIEIPQNLATWLQGNGRLHRLGQLFKQEIITLCMDASYDRTLLANICRKYQPEMIAALHIPDNAQIDGEARPDASCTAERAAFDEEYSHRVIADMIGLREPETTRDAKSPPRRQIRPEDATVLDEFSQMMGVDPVLGADTLPSVPDSKRMSNKRKRKTYSSGHAHKRAAHDLNSSPLANKGKTRAVPAPNPANKQPNHARNPKLAKDKYPLSSATVSVDVDSDEDQLMGGLGDSSPQGSETVEFHADQPADLPESNDRVPSEASEASDMELDQPEPAPTTPVAAAPIVTPGSAVPPSGQSTLSRWITRPAPVSGFGLGHMFGKGGPSTTGSPARLDDHQKTQHAGSPVLNATQKKNGTDLRSVDPVTPQSRSRIPRPSGLTQGFGPPQLSPSIGSGAVQQSPHSSPLERLDMQQRGLREQRNALRNQEQPGFGADKGDAEMGDAGGLEVRPPARRWGAGARGRKWSFS